MMQREAKELVDDLDPADILRVRKAATNKLRYLRSRQNQTLREQVYIPAKKRHDFEMAKQWAIQNKLVESDKNYAFIMMCVLNAVDAMAKQARDEGIVINVTYQNAAQTETLKKPQDDLAGTNTQTTQG